MSQKTPPVQAYKILFVPIIENFIDSFDFTSYDFEFENNKKDPDAEIEKIENDSEWITTLYDKILKREQVLDDDD